MATAALAALLGACGSHEATHGPARLDAPPNVPDHADANANANANANADVSVDAGVVDAHASGTPGAGAGVATWVAGGGGGLLPAGRPVVQGPLPVEIIRRGVEHNLAQLSRCYEQAPTHDPQFAGRVVLRFEIRGVGGDVTRASVDGGRALRSVRSCMAAVARRWRFPGAEVDVPTRVEYPLELLPEAGRGPG